MKNDLLITVVGAGVVGSYLMRLICRNPAVTTVVLVDPDTVTKENILAQAYHPDDAGKSKAEATAARLAGLRPDLAILPLAIGVEELPLGAFQGVTLLCVDNDLARQVAAERAWLAGGVMFDVAVNGAAGLARVTRVAPGPDRACLECTWHGQTYARMPVQHGCQQTPPTKAPAALGAFAASMAAMQFRAWIEQAFDSDREAFELVAAPAGGEMWRSRVPFNPECRFDHALKTFEVVERVDFGMTVGRLFRWLDTESIAVPGFSFATRARCRAGCCEDQDVLWLVRGPLQRPCQRCGDIIDLLSFDARPSIRRSDLPATLTDRRLDAVGLQPGDVVRTDSGRWIQLGKPFQHMIPAAA